LSTVWVIFFVLLLTVVLDRLLFRPILRTMEARAQAISSAKALAERSAAEARAATEEFERKTAAARAEIYRQMDEMRRVAMNERGEILSRTRAEADEQIAAASAALQRETDDARRRLTADAEALGVAAAERILGRKAS